MPRKKTEPEVLQEETMQPETTQAEEPTAAEQPVLAAQRQKNPQSQNLLNLMERTKHSRRKKTVNRPNRRRNPSTIWTSVRSTRIFPRSSGRSGTRSTPPSAAEASCAVRSLALIRIP